MLKDVLEVLFGGFVKILSKLLEGIPNWIIMVIVAGTLGCSAYWFLLFIAYLSG